MGPSIKEKQSGRLLIFVKKGTGEQAIDVNPFRLDDTWVAAKEINNFEPNGTVVMDADELAFPDGFSNLPAGGYELQAVLDVDHSYAYRQRTVQNWISDVTKFDWKPGGKLPLVTISHHFEETPKHIADVEQLRQKIEANEIQEELLDSPVLSHFWGRSQTIHAWIVLPPNYVAKKDTAFPTVYWTHGFTGNLEKLLVMANRIRERMVAGQMPPMIWVMLSESAPQGTHEFADSD